MKSEWTFCPLGELVSFTSGGTPSKHKSEYWTGSIPWISAKTLKSERIKTSDLFISEDGLKAGSKLASCGSVLLLTRGSGLFNGVPIGLVEKDVAFNQDIKCLNSCSEVENKFIFYWLLSQRNYLMAKVGVTGIGAGKFDLDFLQKLEVPVPSAQERHQIIAIGDVLSDKIELNQKINENLQRQTIALYERLLDESNWPTATILDIAEKVAMGPFGSNIKVSTFVPEGVPIISGNHLRGYFLEESEFNYITEEHAERLKNSIVDAQSPVFPRLKRSRCRSSQEVNDSPTPFSALNYCLPICAKASFSLSKPNIAAYETRNPRTTAATTIYHTTAIALIWQ